MWKTTMKLSNLTKNISIIFLIIFAFIFTATVFGQTPLFNYQGRLNDADAPANGTYQFQFKLFGGASGETQIGPTISDVTLNVVDGVYNAKIDFGAVAYSDGEKYLEVYVRRTSSESYYPIEARKPITLSPYLYRSSDSDSTAKNETTEDSSRKQNSVVSGDGKEPNSEESLVEVNGLTVFGRNQSEQAAPFFPGAENYHVVEIGASGTKTPLTLAGGSASMEFWADRGSLGGTPPFAVSFGMARPGLAATSDLIFSTYSTASGWNERMRIASLGNVGIGVSNPTAKLEIGGSLKLTGAGSGITFPDGSKLTTATAGGGTASDTSILSAINDAGTSGVINDNRISGNLG